MKYGNIVKNIFSIVISIIAFILFKKYYILFYAIMELSIIYFLSQLILKNHKIIGNIINDILIFLFNTNIMIYIFSNSFLSYVMLSNITSIGALGEKLFIYIIGALFIFLFSIIPIKYCKVKFNYLICLCTFIFYGLMIYNIGDDYSPLYNYFNLGKVYQKDYSMRKKIRTHQYSNNEFIQSDISNYIEYNKGLGENPNIILIFVEGMSSHIISDKRNITPNIEKYQNMSLSFKNYYNHTAPTYRGLIGQLYSGYQYNNTDINNLVSIESILKDYGYETRFVNVEPYNQEFTDYLNTLGFDEVLPYAINQENAGEEFEYLLNLSNDINKTGKPFFAAMYTVETHLGWDSDRNCFDDCSSNFLNRFHNLDYYYGQFMESFKKSKLYDNTIIVFTTDHASYDDQDYYKAFPNIKRNFNFLDEVPLFIYHKGVTVNSIDVNGRNSLDLAPTLLDYIDISDTNYFLGDSLFASDENNKSKYDYKYFAPTCYYTSKNSKVVGIPVEKQNSFDEELIKYFAAAKTQQ